MLALEREAQRRNSASEPQMKHGGPFCLCVRGKGMVGVGMLFSRTALDSALSLDESSCNMMVVQPIAAIHVFHLAFRHQASKFAFSQLHVHAGTAGFPPRY